MTRFKKLLKELKEDNKARRDLWMFCTTITMGVFLIPFAKLYIESFEGAELLNPKNWVLAFALVMGMFIVYIGGLLIFITGKKIWRFQ